ncbi:MAG: hypothetical protein KKA73_16905 [Chloroflexi bacterium]|nr:hypothetical protein [Chloroflexota bacterium]MBU1749367.1 hypothetical protein [Chloroflexota bacterium]
MNETILQAADIILILAANVINVLIAALFLARTRGRDRLESALGLVVVAMGVPAGVVAVINLLAQRPLWAVVMPTLLALFCAVEFTLDYLLHIEWRRTPRLVGPYTAVYYLALMGMVGYAFLVTVPWGIVTLITYFVNLLATWYSHR